MPYISFDQLSPLSCRPSPQVARDRMWASREPRSGSVEVISCEPAIRSRGRSDSNRSKDLRQSSRLIGHPVILPQGDALTLSPRGRPPKTDTQGRSRAPLGGSCRPRTESGTRSIAARPVGAIRASGRAGWPTGRPIRSCPPYGWTARSCARTSARRARPSAKALGRNRGGFSPQIHSLTDRRGRPLRLYVTGGPRHASTQSRLVETWTDAPLSCLIADQAYDGDAFRAWRAQRGIEAVIPARNGTRRATPWNGASAGSNAGVAMINTRDGSWVFCTWQGPGSGCHPTLTRPRSLPVPYHPSA